MVDKEGIINRQEPGTMLNDGHREIAQITNPSYTSGKLADALIDADVLVGVSRPRLVTKEMVSTMSKNAIIFAMANPEPEIFPDEAKAGGAAVVGTGRADFPNMVNNVVAFPGIVKGALSVRASDINQAMCLAAAIAVANSVPASELKADHIFPEPLNTKIPCIVAKAVAEAAKQSGVARANQ
ncbi:MAG: sfcA [Anaerosporomusa subterranea]|jgi:malate dehydrogenase (oxaloacetate-decarboxylating)|nr:sfcA [Anaerosporomusa subterranea]